MSRQLVIRLAFQMPENKQGSNLQIQPLLEKVRASDDEREALLTHLDYTKAVFVMARALKQNGCEKELHERLHDGWMHVLGCLVSARTASVVVTEEEKGEA